MIIYFSLDRYQILLFPQACIPIKAFTDSCMYDKDKKGTTGFGGNDLIKVSKTSYAAEIETANGPRHEKICLRGFANNKGADQPARTRRLISTFVIRLLLSIISRLATSEISIF